MDALDLAIVEQLQLDGRKPYTEIAQALSVSEGTVRNRVSRLVDDQILQIVGVVDPHILGKDAPALIGVTLQPGDWDPWILWVALIWALVLAIFALKTYFDRPTREGEIDREVRRLRSGG